MWRFWTKDGPISTGDKHKCPREGAWNLALRALHGTAIDIEEQPASESVLAGAQARIDELRDWAMSLPNCCERASYAEWLDYFESKVTSAREKPVTESWGTKFDRERSELNQRVEEYRAQYGFTKPPSKREMTLRRN